MSVQSIRTALAHLKKTKDVSISTNRHYTVFTLNNYDSFILPTNDQQTANKQSTNDQQTPNNNETNITNQNKADKATSRGLTADERAQLVREYGEKNIADYIRRLDDWIASAKPKKMRSYEATLRSWLERDGVQKPHFSDGFDAEKYKIFINYGI